MALQLRIDSQGLDRLIYYLNTNATKYEDGSYDNIGIPGIKWAQLGAPGSGVVYLYTEDHPEQRAHFTITYDQSIHFTTKINRQSVRDYDSDHWQSVADWIRQNLGGYNPDNRAFRKRTKHRKTKRKIKKRSKKRSKKHLKKTIKSKKK